tara:strand:+ start:512 stop:706 length:195 start_codon:yes stop_codon:yes gene_type:complete
MMVPIHHEELCLWNIGIRCIACGKEQYIGEIYNNWSEANTPADFMQEDPLPIKKMTDRKRGKYL